MSDTERTSEPQIAVIGMSGRFPGADSVEAFWQNVKNGVESITFFSDEDLLQAGTPASLLRSPKLVKARALLNGVEYFDAAFFGLNAREAEIMDPQHRLFLECAWEALESAGYNAAGGGRRVGVYAGAGMNTYLINLYSNRELMNVLGAYSLLTASSNDFLTTRVSYKLDLSGPSITVQTACSTSLVAAHLACQSLLNGECDMALAGGVSVVVPQKSGHLYQEDSILSPDGHCRAFDADAKGTVSGDGVGVVLLKRFADALADGDMIHAVIKGSAVNNDGAAKAGFTAPSVSAQSQVIMEAQAMAGVDPATIGYVEAHGTATPLGDPIEVAALIEAFGPADAGKRYCAIGSVKTNIGHLDAAAGIVGLIKVVKALEEKQLPPSLHFKQPNPAIDFKNGPFYVNTQLADWRTNGSPRRAGVSSFGMGGTNAHLIVEEAPGTSPSGPSRSDHLLLFSAKTEAALEQVTSNLCTHFNRHPSLNPADAAYTLQVGRQRFDHRRMVVCRDLNDAREVLGTADPLRVLTSIDDSADRAVGFLFPGQGTQYVRMGAELYEGEAEFREQVNGCSEMLEPQLGLDLRRVLYPEPAQVEESSRLLDQTSVTQAALFVTEYALAKLWMAWGVQPRVMIGHSIGEYVAACLAGVFSLADALAVVAARGLLMQGLPEGAMLAVSLPESEARALLGDRLSLAAINSPRACVVSGPPDAITGLQRGLEERKVRYRRLRTSHAFHSEMMAPILRPFSERMQKVKLNPPLIRYLSNLTGNWITPNEATDPDYWVNHLRRTVRFSEGLGRLVGSFDGVLLEAGPGESLTASARQSLQSESRVVLPSMRHPSNEVSDTAFMLTTLGKLWLAGVSPDWVGVYRHQRRLRVPLPTYPFERRRFWINMDQTAYEAAGPTDMQRAPVSLPEHPRPDIQNSYLAPANDLERALVEIWQASLGINQIGIYDDFFGLGGDSLLATHLLSRAGEIFEVDLPLHTFFAAPTISELATLIDSLLTEKVKELSNEEFQRLIE
ncbi:MAG TPA: beta-ketoacyl synthase N-terminal-like domain-containing protein [Blastocatellia bacterium]|nr:beta-ketoacyl synthase N-terminal-like domain-containing protein [Blastocatellia bacterium]